MQMKKRSSEALKKEKDRAKIVRVGLVQTHVSDDIIDNMRRTIEKTEEAAKKGAQVVCLQELYRTKYFPQAEKRDVSRLAEKIPGESTEAFSRLAEERRIVVILPLFEKGLKGKYYNSAVTIDANGKIIGHYRKIHIPYDPSFYEKSYFQTGDLDYEVCKTKYASVGVLICYDQWFPEPARILALKGAEVIFFPTAIGWIKNHAASDGDWHGAWKTIQRSHAIANGVHVAAVNRVGQEDQLSFWGGSFLCDSFGNIIGEASQENEEVLVVKADLNKNRSIQEGWGFFRNRHPETYGWLVKN